MRQKQKKQYIYILITVVLSALVIGFVAAAASAAGSGVSEQSVSALEQSLRRAAVECYCAEGAYPAGWAYLSENYGIRVDSDKYIVHYGYNGQNIMPDITVIPKV